MDLDRKSMDMANGPLLKNILIFSIPLIFSNILQMFFNSADTIIVGKFAGDKALAAVGSTGSIVFLITSLFNGLATGTNVVVARYIGTGNKDKIKDSVHTSIALATAGGIVLTFIGLFFSKVFLRMMSTPEDFIDLSATYMRIYFMGVIFLLLYNFGSAILRSKGDTQRPLYFLLISGVLNIVLNFITVYFFHLSVIGAASATVASEALSAFLVLNVLFHEEDATRLDMKHLYFDKESILDIMRIGIPAGLSGAVFALSNVVIQSSINSFNSTDVVAGNAAGNNVENYVYIGYMAFTQATITFTSQCMGAGRLDRIKQIMVTTMAMVVVGAIIMGTAVYLAGPFVLRFYTDKPEVVAVGMVRIRLVASLLVLNGILDVFVNSLRGMGVSTLPTILMVVGICGVRLLWIYTMFPIHHTLESIYLCFPISWAVTSIVEFILWIIVYRRTMAQAY
ncbi:MAG: MATE family efflux transporter [Erysipelotrichaceae bacterium]|nr:MATE family efflux transporter [Erysipelotrichaceae bacterium]MBQ1346711.1 MATE family efflux transporter [Erysipelotrichaceae bacterium]MBQ1775293.1 MATE family efflux transporter [Erysipelotrichaceae bacterium]MBQ2079993.1 MATE family efflux transporter [Erysipelotrichaceae bacterium]MBQ2656546.1 MATE family efflux transporter [Erysipelotrichaceae bacterium]